MPQLRNQALTANIGAVVRLEVGFSSNFIRVLGHPNPTRGGPFQTLDGILDTGIEYTLIRANLLSQPPLGLSPTGMRTLRTSTSTLTQLDSYDVSLTIIDSTGTAIVPLSSFDVIEYSLPVFPSVAIDAVIGRDILDQCEFVYDGKNRQFSLVY